MKIKASLGAYSSVVGQSVHLTGEGGRMEAQIALLHHGDMFRDRAKQIELLTVIVNAINGTQDRRPLNCRFRLQEAGQPYPRSSCNACAGNILTGLGNQCRMVKAEAAPEPENPYKDELLKIAAMVGEPEDPFAAWEVIGHLQSTAMVSAEEVKVEGEPEVDPIKEAFCAGWITNAAHESGDYLTGCMEADYRDWQKDPMGYFVDAWKVALAGGAAAFEQTCETCGTPYDDDLSRCLTCYPAEEEGTVSTGVPYPKYMPQWMMRAIAEGTIKAEKIDIDNSASGIRLLIAAEREACAKLLEDTANLTAAVHLEGPRIYAQTMRQAAELIRQRGDTVPAEQGEN